MSAAALHTLRQALLVRGDALQLHSLRLSGCQLPAGVLLAGQRLLAALACLRDSPCAGVFSQLGPADGLKRTLQRLDLSHNLELAYDGAHSVLAPLSAHTELEVLPIAGAPFHLCAMVQDCPALQLLDLHGTGRPHALRGSRRHMPS